MSAHEFDRELVALVERALAGSHSDREKGWILYSLVRTACYLHAQEFGTDNGRRLVREVVKRVFDEMPPPK